MSAELPDLDLASPSQLSTMASEIYATEPSLKFRLMQRYRPYICPFDQLFSQVPVASRVLDVGCGAGIFLLLLAKSGRIASGHGFDVSTAAIAAATNACREQNLTNMLSFTQRDVQEGLPAGDWNLISSLDVLHHVPAASQQAYFHSLCRATPTGGRLLIKDMVSRPKWRALANHTHDLLLAKQWVRHRSPEEAKQWAREAGMRVVHEAQANTLWYGHWLLVLEPA